MIKACRATEEKTRGRERSEWEALRLRLFSNSAIQHCRAKILALCDVSQYCGKHRLRGARYRVNTKTGLRKTDPSVDLRARDATAAAAARRFAYCDTVLREIAKIWRLCCPPRVLKRSRKMKDRVSPFTSHTMSAIR